MTAQLMALHATLAIVSTSPEWNIEEKEAAMVVQSFANASRHYMDVVSEKTRDTWAFATIIMVAYGSRILAINRRKVRERATRQATGQPAVVVQPANKPTIKGNGPIAGAPPVTRPRTEADNAMLDEIPVPVFN